MNWGALASALFVNFCVLVTLAFFGSLTYSAEPGGRRWRRLARFGLSALAGVVLLWFAFVLPLGLRLDLRAVPVVLAGLYSGPWTALAVALPAMVYRLLLGGAGAWPALLNLVLLAALSGWLWRPLTAGRVAGGREWWLYALSFLAADLSFLLVPGLPTGAALTHAALLTAVQTLGLLAALAVVNVRLRATQRLTAYRSQAYLDALTGLANRRQFDEDLQALRPGERVQLIMLDLDHFKRVNDRYGHGVGDEVLRGLGDLLAGSMRAGQRAYRLGGEEFAVLVREVNALAVARMADRLRETVAARLPGLLGRPELSITVSVGVAAYDGHPARLLDTADARLYAAKRAGRNRTVVEDVAVEDR